MVTPRGRSRFALLAFCLLAGTGACAPHSNPYGHGGTEYVVLPDTHGLPPADSTIAVLRSLSAIRARMTALAIDGGYVRRLPDRGVVVQVPAGTDSSVVRRLFTNTRLEFELVCTPERASEVFQRLAAFDSARAGRAGALARALRAPVSAGGTAGLDAVVLADADVPAVEQLLAVPGLGAVVPADVQLVWGPAHEPLGGGTGCTLYALARRSELDGAAVAFAQASAGIDAAHPERWGVTVKLTPAGTAQFARVTAANVGRRLAIVLDGAVVSAPVIRERIAAGRASLTGEYSPAAARQLAATLGAGALPAPMRIVRQRQLPPR
jgi:preprotein translocase subunit SecD